jgi:L-serine dehydratase
MARDLMDEKLDEVLVEFHPAGSLATTHSSQGSDMGLCGGLLGWNPTDERLVRSVQAIEEAGIRVIFAISDYPAEHPNTYQMTLRNSTEKHTLTAISTGGGMIELLEIDGVELFMGGDYYETLIYMDDEETSLIQYLTENVSADEICLLRNDPVQFVEVKGQNFLAAEIITELKKNFRITKIKTVSPVLPVLSHKEMEVPFRNCTEMYRYNEEKDLDLWELAVHYEMARGNLTSEQVFGNMKEIVRIMQNSILAGLEGTEYTDRILGPQSLLFQRRLDEGKLLDGGILNKMILYVTAMMEMKSAMGVIVAAPTAGSCGALPGACVGAATAMELSEDDITRALLAAGIIGVFISNGATFAAEVGGCQAETGAAAGMAAAGLVTLMNGTTTQAIAAASMALQNTLGIICDPVANRVEVPCLGKNIMAAGNALASANMALADFDEVIPLDEVIETMDKVGKSLPSELCCTALGGLSITRASKEIEAKLNRLSKTGPHAT